MAISIPKRLEQLEDLPTIPQTLQRVLEGLDSVTTSAQNLEEIIREDPILTAKILKLANSSYYGLKGEVSSIARAVVILGFEEVKNLVIGLSLTGTFSGDLGFEEFQAPSLWLHSIGVATTAKMLAELIPELDADELFTAGMLHDLGRFLMCLYFSEELRQVLEIQKKKGMTMWEAEMQVGLTHWDVGAYLTAKWGLSDFLISVVRHHHYPKKAGPNSRAAAVVFLADQLCHKLELGWGDPGQPTGGKLLVPKTVGLEPNKIKQVASKIKDMKQEIEGSWGAVVAG